MTSNAHVLAARPMLACALALTLICGAIRARAEPSNGGPGTTAQGGTAKGIPGTGSNSAREGGKDCLCYGTKHDGPLKDLCVIKCRCPGQCGTQGARRPTTGSD